VVGSPRSARLDVDSSDGAFGDGGKDTTPVLANAKDLTEALDFLVRNLRSHMDDYHHKTDSRPPDIGGVLRGVIAA
jgi:hypothetical protein